MVWQRISVGAAIAAAGILCAATTVAQPIGDRTTLENLLGGSGVLEDFESYSIAPGASDPLNVSSLNSTTVTNSQGPGLVEPGVTYFSGDNIAWNGSGYYGLATKTIEGYSGLDFTLIYDPPVQAMGFDMLDF
ncbi:MAG: hypothetical protein ACF8PN_09805 [Phycisphaerales bacterium]